MITSPEEPDDELDRFARFLSLITHAIESLIPKMNNALAIYSKIENPIEAAKQMGEMISESRMIGVKNPEAGAVVAFTCMSECITPLEFHRKYHIIQGQPSERSWSMLARFADEEGCSYEILEVSPDKVGIRFTANGQTIDAAYTWEEAQQSRWPWKDWKNKEEGLKDNWATPEDRENQLFARLVSRWCKRLRPSLFHGTYTPEEVIDTIPAKAVTVVEETSYPSADEVSGIAPTSDATATENVTDVDAVVIEPAEEGLPPDASYEPGIEYVSEKDALEIQSLFDFACKAGSMTEESVQQSLTSMRCGKPGASKIELLHADQAAELLQKLRAMRDQLEGKA